MMPEFIAGLLGTLAGGGVLIGLLVFFGEKFVGHQLEKALAEHQHGLNEKLAALGASILRVNELLSRRNEREFAITEQLWERMVKAVGAAQERLNSSRRRPVFRMQSETEAAQTIAGLPFEENEKAKLLAADPQERDELYAHFDLRRAVDVCYGAWAEFKNFLNIKEIFIDTKVLLGLREICDDLLGLIIGYRIYLEDGHSFSEMPLADRVIAERKLMVEVGKKIDALALVVRSRFGFN